MTTEMTRLDKIAADITAAQQDIPNGDITAEPGRSILAARLRLQHEHAPYLLDFARDVQTVHARYFNTDVPPDHEDAGCEPEDVWRFDRDFRAALSALTETEETNDD